MFGLRIPVTALALALGLLGPVPAETRVTSGERLLELVEEYYEELLQLHPVLATYNGDHRFDDRFTVDIAPAHRRRAVELEQRYRMLVESLEPAGLDAQERLTRDLFLRGRRERIEAYAFPDHLMPLDQIQSWPVLLAMLGGGQSIQPFATVEDYESWLARLDGWGPWVDQAIVNMGEGIETGFVLPRAVVERVLPILDGLVVDDPRDSVFFGPIERMPPEFGAPDRERLEQAYLTAIGGAVVPAYARLRDFVRETYLPRARRTTGLSDLPGGREMYAFAVRARTTTGLTPEEIHRVGLAEVARIEAEIERVERMPWPEEKDSGEPARGPLLDGYRALQERVGRKLPLLFDRMPAASFEIRPVEEFRRQSAPGASYVAGSPDGSRPGVFYVNASPGARGVPAEELFLHEAIPGHHFQISLSRELAQLPRFRRFGHFTAYSEGWALYVEGLGESLGLYRTRYQALRALRSELFRARRLVVDTGLHAMGWSRQRAIAYLGSAREVDRYIVLPAQALAYKVGQLRISELRARAEQRLGDRFDIREFHDVVLRDGALPLDVLESRIDAWISEQEREPE